MRSLKAELLKLVTTRSIYGLLAGEVAVVVLTTVSTVLSAKAGSLTGAINDQVFFLLVAINVGIFSLILGMRTVTDEYRHETIAHAFLSDPGRGRTVVAKAAAGALGASVLAAISLSVMIALALPLAGTKQGALALSAGDTGAFAGFIAGNALWAVIGVGVAAVVRHQIPAIVGGVVWVLVFENLGSGFLGDAGGYLPGQSAYALARALDAGSALAAAPAAGVMAVYAAGALLIGLGFVRRRDVV